MGSRYATQGSNPRLADPRQVCYSHVLSLALDRWSPSMRSAWAAGWRSGALPRLPEAGRSSRQMRTGSSPPLPLPRRRLPRRPPPALPGRYLVHYLVVRISLQSRRLLQTDRRTGSRKERGASAGRKTMLACRARCHETVRLRPPRQLRRPPHRPSASRPSASRCCWWRPNPNPNPNPNPTPTLPLTLPLTR